MNKNRLSKIAITSLALILTLLTFGCQSDQSTNDATQQEDEMQVNKSQAQGGITSTSTEKITNITWQWAELIEKDPAAQSVVLDPENYTVTFWDDGSFDFKADCNSGGGSYTVQGSQMAFGPMMSTMAMCPPDSLHDTFLAKLGVVDSFGVADDKLVFSLKEDAGEMRFANGGSAKKAQAVAEAPEVPAPEEKTIFVGPEKANCVGVGPMECYLVKENPDDEWQYFYDPIEGFEWEPGYTYELSVAIYSVENPPEDASALRYELLEVVNKVETPLESKTGAAYIRIDKPMADAELDASKAIVIRGMGAALFEGNVVVQILDADGNELALQPTIIQSPEAGTGGEGPWETEISITIENATAAKIVAFSPSPKDGEGWTASDEVVVKLNPEMAVKTNLENTPWILRSFAQQENINALLSVNQVTALFNPEDSSVSGSTGCNRFFSSYTLDGNQLTLDNPIATTRMACREPQALLEQTYLVALEKVASYEMSRNAMKIHDAEGEVLLVYQVDPYSMSESFSREELASSSYLNEFAKAGVVQLVGGMYREPAAEGSAIELVVMLTNQAVFGDVTHDGREDAVVVLVSQPGGSGSFFDLAVVRKQDEALTNMARIQLGDRIQIKSLQIENGEIVVDMVTQGSEDAMCCPTQYVSNRYVLENGKLVLVLSEAIE